MSSDSRNAVKKTTPRVIRELRIRSTSNRRQEYICIEPALNLYVSVTEKGRKTFVFRKKVDGSWKNIDLGCRFRDDLDDTAGRVAIQAAQAKASELTAKLNSGADPFVVAKKAKDDPTFQNLFDAYKTGHLEKRAKRVRDAENDFKRWFGKVANKKASTFSYSDANEIHQSMTSRISKVTGKGTPYSANRAMQLGRAIFNFAIKNGIVECRNPFAGISLNREEPRDRFLSDREAATLIGTVIDKPLRHCSQRTLYDFILLDMILGVRKSNLLEMRWDEIDEESWIWVIPGLKMKNGKTKAMQLGPFEIDILKERRKILKESGIISPWVFPSDKSRSGHLVDPGNGWEKLRSDLGMPDVTIHDLRRSLASAMMVAGVDAAVVQKTLSHTDPRTTAKHYIMTTTQAEAEARELVLKKRLDSIRLGAAPEVSTVKPLRESRRSSRRGV